MDSLEDEELEHEEYESGPYCRHFFFDPSDCTELCSTCGHRCWEHNNYIDDTSCNEQSCNCTEWVECGD